jgi:hypothetical protein
MRGGIRVIRRALIGEVECYVDATLPGSVDQPSEIVERAEIRMNSFMSASLSADAPRTARLSGLRLRRIVFSLPE